MLELKNTYLGIELGSTRIKAVLVGDDYAPLASGSHDWENRLENGYWTYSQEDIHGGVRACFADLAADGVTLLVSSHVMDEAERCDRLVLLRDGEVIADSTLPELLAATGASNADGAFLTLVRRERP